MKNALARTTFRSRFLLSAIDGIRSEPFQIERIFRFMQNTFYRLIKIKCIVISTVGNRRDCDLFKGTRLSTRTTNVANGIQKFLTMREMICPIWCSSNSGRFECIVIVAPFVRDAIIITVVIVRLG